jgi:hypothetical protein
LGQNIFHLSVRNRYSRMQYKVTSQVYQHEKYHICMHNIYISIYLYNHIWSHSLEMIFFFKLKDEKCEQGYIITMAHFNRSFYQWSARIPYGNCVGVGVEGCWPQILKILLNMLLCKIKFSHSNFYFFLHCFLHIKN